MLFVFKYIYNVRTHEAKSICFLFIKHLLLFQKAIAFLLKSICFCFIKHLLFYYTYFVNSTLQFGFYKKQ